MKKILFLFSMIGLLVVILVFVLNNLSVTIEGDQQYAELDSIIREYDLFDVGVVDVNKDDLLDIFTVNHSARQSLLLNTTGGKFRDALTLMRLDQDIQFPGLEDSLEEPEIDKPGLYVYRTNRWLHIRAHAIDETDAVQGAMDVPWPVHVQESPASVHIFERSDASGAIFTTIEFSLQGDQEIVLIGGEDIVEIPHSVRLSDSIDLSNVFVGIELVNPDSPEFELTWRDRHGIAWADYDGDGDIDLFVSRGGIKGKLDDFPLAISDELFAFNGASYTDQADSSRLRKGNCPSRQVSWIDFDGDGDLDLYVSCGRDPDPIFPNQLFRQDSNYQFVDIAADLGLDFASASVFAWVDSDSDHDMDLLSVEDGRLFHYLNDGGEFEKRAIGNDFPGARIYKLAIADYDNDGDFDAFAVHGAHSFLVLNTNGRFSLQMPSSTGLPDHGKTANWVDFNNDGLIDLHVVPGGMYQQNSDNTFQKIDVLAHKGQHPGLVDARSSWFDMDNDGYRDVIFAVKSGPDLWQRVLRKLAGRDPDLRDRWQASFFRYAGPRSNHWLQIQLDGPPQNNQAIGARAYVTTAGGTQLQQIGGAEGSHFSQGHYRLYYGLGEHTTVSEIRIEWPNGRTQILSDLAADQLLHVSYDMER